MLTLTINLPILTALLLTVTPVQAQQTGGKLVNASPVVIEICRELKRPPAICKCSATKMQASVVKESFDHYQAVGATYLRLKRDGKRRRHAWSIAVSERADSTGEHLDQLTEKMTIAADDHLHAIQDCGKQ